MDLTALLPRSRDSVTLRELAHRDASAYATGTTDPDVRRFGHLPEPQYTAERVRQLIDAEIAAGLAAGTLAVLAIADRGTDAFLGSLVLFDVTVETAEIGFWLAPDGRGRGAATMGLELGKDLARGCGLATLRARTAVGNVASRRILQSAGFRPREEPAVGTAPSGEVVELQEYTVEL